MQFTNPVSARKQAAGSRWGSGALLSAFALIATLSACSAGGPQAGPAPAAPTSAQTQTKSPQTTQPAPTKAPEPSKTPVVILISVDALNPEAITKLGSQGRAPTLLRLVNEGASTFNARTAYEQTNTLPNHTGMLTGRPITGKLGHHVTFNEVHPGSLDSLNGHYIAGMFDPVHDNGLSTAFYAAKSKFSFLIRSWNADAGAPDETGADNGRDKLDAAEIGDDPVLVRHLIHQLDHDPANLTFLHLRGADEAGHGDTRDGFMGPKYLDAVAAIDGELGTLITAIDARPALKRRVTVILTADHGGRGTDAESGLGHRNPTKLENYRIPFIAWGRGIGAHTDLYALNRAGRKDPGADRATYSGMQPIRNLDASDLVLSLFGLPALPGTLPGGRIVLQVR